MLAQYREGPSRTPTINSIINLHQHESHEEAHEKLVSGFRRYLQQRERQLVASWVPERGYYLPVELIRVDLMHKGMEDPLSEARHAFFSPLLSAWSAIAYDQFEPGSGHERASARILSFIYQEERENTIKLYGSQIKTLDALAAVAGIPRVREQAEIPIAEKLWDYKKWFSSDEYRQRLATTKTNR